MDAETKEELEGSIAKWDREEVVDMGGLNCPLCDRFAWDSCKGCPVMEVTGESLCKGTPYEEWVAHMVQAHPEQKDTDSWITVPGCAECIRIQKAEADFLKSLREVS